MSPIIILIVIFFLIFVFWQFGARLSARYAITWWAGGAFLLFCTVFPASLGPIAKLLGIELISNFVIAGLLLFLFFQSIDLTSDLSKSNRIVRRLISEDAAASKRPIPSSNESQSQGKCLIILPCYNEEASLRDTIRHLKETLDAMPGIDYLVVDDGSVDQSKNILADMCSDNCLSHKANIGVAGVLLTGFRYAQIHNYDFVVQCDSDGQHPIEKIPEIIEKAKANRSDLLIGSRFLSGVAAGIRTTTFARVCGILMLRLSLGLFGVSARVTDPTSGFRVYSRKAINILANNMPDEYPEPESVAILAQSGLKISEYAVEMSARSAGVSSISGMRQLRYFAKVTAALIGLRLRNIFD